MATPTKRDSQINQKCRDAHFSADSLYIIAGYREEIESRDSLYFGEEIKKAIAKVRAECADRAIHALHYLDLDGDLRDLDYMRDAIMGAEAPKEQAFADDWCDNEVHAEEKLAFRDAEIRRLREALERIAKVGYGVELSDTDEELAAYWSHRALFFQDIARAALDAKGRE